MDLGEQDKSKLSTSLIEKDKTTDHGMIESWCNDTNEIVS